MIIIYFRKNDQFCLDSFDECLEKTHCDLEGQIHWK